MTKLGHTTLDWQDEQKKAEDPGHVKVKKEIVFRSKFLSEQCKHHVVYSSVKQILIVKNMDPEPQLCHFEFLAFFCR